MTVADIAVSTAPLSVATHAPAASVAAASTGSDAFHTLLSELNPLQYLPVVGTLYRSLTGDTIPESIRAIGSLVVSGLMGGPVGVVTNVALLAVEKLTGIDPEQIGHDVLASIGIGSSEHTAVAGDQASPPAARQTAAVASPAQAWSASQLTAYGVVTTADGSLKRGDLVGSDVLNSLELARNGVGDTGSTQVAAL